MKVSDQNSANNYINSILIALILHNKYSFFSRIFFFLNALDKMIIKHKIQLIIMIMYWSISTYISCWQNEIYLLSTTTDTEVVSFPCSFSTVMKYSPVSARTALLQETVDCFSLLTMEIFAVDSSVTILPSCNKNIDCIRKQLHHKKKCLIISSI